MLSNVITVDEARKYNKEVQRWSSEAKSPEFFGIIPGYVCAWNIEVEKDGEFDCESCTFSNNYYTVGVGYEGWEEGNLFMSEILEMKGWKPTGNIIFRGYYIEKYDSYEREEYYEEADIDISSYVNTTEYHNMPFSEVLSKCGYSF